MMSALQLTMHVWHISAGETTQSNSFMYQHIHCIKMLIKIKIDR